MKRATFESLHQVFSHLKRPHLMPHDAFAAAKFSAGEPAEDSARLSPTELAAFRQQCLAFNSAAADPMSDAERECLPESISRFQIIRRLGSGSFGCVYEAYDQRLSRRVAVKVSHLGIHDSEHMRAKFRHEAQAAARLAHPNVVSLHEYGEEQGLLYLVYEMCEGPTLEEWLSQQQAPVPIDLAVSLVRELAKGLFHAHVRGLVHRDVKPQNVLLTPNYDDQSRLPFVPRITDFGLATNWTAEGSHSASARLVGSLDTMSPEQARGESRHVTPAADQYSLGIVLYRLLTGTVPFAGDDVVRTLQRICNELPRSPRSLRREVSRDLEAIVTTCLNKRPEARYATCKELSRDLERFQRGVPVAARPLRSDQRCWRWICAAPVVSSLILAIILGSVASTVVFSMMTASLSAQRQELQATVRELTLSEANAIRARQATEAALQAVTKQKRVAEQRRLQAIQQAYRADMHRAYEAWSERQVLGTLQMLDGLRDNMQGVMEPCFGFQMLLGQVQRSASRLAFHTAPATEVCSVPNTTWVVSSGHHGKIVFHDLPTGKVVHTAVPHPGAQIDALDISHDGRCLAVSFNSPDFLSPQAELFELQIEGGSPKLGKVLKTYYSSTTIEALRLSPCGRYLVIGQRYEPALVYDLKTTKLLASVPTTRRNRSVDFSADGELCLLIGEGHELWLVEPHTGHVVRRIACPDAPQYARWLPGSEWIAYTCHNDSQVHLASTTRESVGASLPQSRGFINTLDFSPDGHWLIAGTRRGGVVKWPLVDWLASAGLPTQPLPAPTEYVSHSGEVTAVCAVGTESLVSVSDSGSVVVNPLHELAVEPLDPEVTTALLIEIAGSATLLQGYSDGHVSWVAADSEQSLDCTQLSRTPVSTLNFCRAGQLVAVGWEDGQIAVYNLNKRQWLRCQYTAPDDSLDERRINSLCLSRNGKWLAGCGDDARLRLWALDGAEQPRWEKRLNSYAHVTCFVGTGQVAVGGMFEDILIFDLGTGETIHKLFGAGRTTSLLYDPTRQRLISGHGDGRIRLYDGEQLGDVHTLNVDGQQINSLIGSPEWDCYLSGDSAGAIKVWSANPAELMGCLHTIDTAEIAGLAISPQNRELHVLFGLQPPAAPRTKMHAIRLTGSR